MTHGQNRASTFEKIIPNNATDSQLAHRKSVCLEI